MSCAHRTCLEAADAEVEAARRTLAAALQAPLSDETANERICAAVDRVRAAQARQTAANTELSSVRDWVRSG